MTSAEIEVMYLSTPHIEKPRAITKREQEVLQFISHGMTNQEIAGKMFLSPHTTETHRRHLMQKLCARNKANLVRIGMELGLI